MRAKITVEKSLGVLIYLIQQKRAAAKRSSSNSEEISISELLSLPNNAEVQTSRARYVEFLEDLPLSEKRELVALSMLGCGMFSSYQEALEYSKGFNEVASVRELSFKTEVMDKYLVNGIAKARGYFLETK